MVVAVASDHAGYGLKEAVLQFLRARGLDVTDCGTDGEESCDYPEFASKAAQMVSEGGADCAVLVCGTGSGVAIVANKFRGVRAVNAYDREIAEMAKLHNNANILTLGSRRLEPREATEILSVWLDTEYEGGRHQRRLDQITEIEERGLDG